MKCERFIGNDVHKSLGHISSISANIACDMIQAFPDKETPNDCNKYESRNRRKISIVEIEVALYS